MKNFYLILNDIKRLFKQNKLTFFVVIISMAVSTFGYLFYSGYILKDFLSAKKDKGIIISINTKRTLDKKKVAEICKVMGYEEDFINQFSISESEISTIHQNGSELVGEYNSDYENSSNWITSGAYYNRDESMPLLCISADMVQPMFGMNSNPINKKIIINDVEYTVCSVISFMYVNHYAVPVRYYIENLPVVYIKAMYNSSLNDINLANIQRNLENYKEDIAFRIIKPQSPLLSLKFWMQTFQIVIIFILIIISLFIIIAYWIKRNRKIFNIYSIVGGSRVKVQLLIILQTFILLLIGGVFGAIMFFVIQGTLANWRLIQDGYYSIYLAVMLVVIVVLFMFTTVISIKSNTGNQIYIIKD